MKHIHFSIYDELADQINSAITRWGFSSRAEFFRYLAMEFLRQEKTLKTTDDILKEHTKALRQVKAAQKRPYLYPFS